MTNSERYRGFEIISNSDTGSWQVQEYFDQPDHSLGVRTLASAPTAQRAREWIDRHLLFLPAEGQENENTDGDESLCRSAL